MWNVLCDGDDEAKVTVYAAQSANSTDHRASMTKGIVASHQRPQLATTGQDLECNYQTLGYRSGSVARGNALTKKHGLTVQRCKDGAANKPQEAALGAKVG